MSSLKNLVALNLARFNRIRRKPPSEVLTFLVKRSRQALAHVRDRIRLIFGEIKLNDKEFFGKLSLENPNLVNVKKAVEKEKFEVAKTELAAYMRSRNSPKFYFSRDEKKRLTSTLEEKFPQSKTSAIESAERILKHDFTLLGKNFSFGDSIDWHYNDKSSESWPLTFSPNIDYFSSNRRGDIKIPWELNRTQHFVILGKAYWFTNDEKYTKEFVNQFLSWIKSNPYKLGINWMEGIEASIRMFSWIWSYNFFLDSECFNEKAHTEFLKSVYTHANFISNHLSDKWRINNNHLIAEVAGLILVGVMFPEFKDAEMWRKKGIEIFENELKTQVLPDGFIWEQSTGYHKFVTDFLLHIVILMRKNGMDIPETFLQKLGQSLEALYVVAKPDGFLPLVGDEDQGFVVNLSEYDYADAKPTISCGSISLGKDEWKRTNCEENLWLFGSSSLTEKPVNSKISSRLFENTGFMVMHDEDKYMLISIGPQDSRYSHAPHKHMDELSFVLDANGDSFIVDPGTYTYFGDFKWRKYFKRKKAHNTIVIDEKDPVDIKEIFESSNVPICKIHDYKISDKLDWIATEYYGYEAVTHTRQILFVKPEYWIIIDSLRGDGEHTCDLYFHFNRGLELKRNTSDQSITAASSIGNMKVSSALTSEIDEEILDGEISPKYGVKIKAPILRYRKTGKLPITFITLLHPSTKDEQNIECSQFEVYGEDGKPLNENEAVGIKVASNGHTDYFVCSLDGMPRDLSFEKVRNIRGRIVHCREQGNRVKR